MLTIARQTARLLDIPIEVTTMDAACERTIALSRQRRPAYVCFATAHMLVETTRNSMIRDAYSSAEIVNPDGVPLAWCLKLMGFQAAECVSGPRLFPQLLRLAAKTNRRIGFYGGREETLHRIRVRIQEEFKDLKIAYMHSPPFRPLTEAEQQDDIRQIIESGTEILFVGLGSPKQELWMRRWCPQIPCVSLGVGAAFEFFSGEKILPPLWIQKMGLTWFVRLCQEPKRLIRRNLASPIFVYLILKEFALRIVKGPNASLRMGRLGTAGVVTLSDANAQDLSDNQAEISENIEQEIRDVEICI
jgi:N-acetylglucosaminyldiphosphoundecaprenol N-acetyl-beta-D-mannosaminyltransferase